MDKRCKSCKYLRVLVNPMPDYHLEFLCRFTNKLVNVFDDGENCATYETVETEFTKNT